MSDNCSNHHKYNLFLQNSNNESFRKLLYGSSRETDLKACSMLSGIINCCERLNEQKILKSNDYSNYSDNENIRSARQLYKEKIKHPYFDKLQRTSSHLTQLLDAAKKDYRKELNNGYTKVEREWPCILHTKNSSGFHARNYGNEEGESIDEQFEQQSQSESSDEMNATWHQSCPPELQNYDSKIGSKSGFERFTHSLKQSENPFVSSPSSSVFGQEFEQYSQSDSSDEIDGSWAPTDLPDFQNSNSTINSTPGFKSITKSFEQSDNSFVSSCSFSEDDDQLSINNSFQKRLTGNDLVFDVSPSINESEHTALKCHKKNREKERKNNEKHKIVKRRGRFNIRKRSKELGTHFQRDRKHRIAMLQTSAECINKLKKDRKRLAQLEEKLKQSELRYTMLLLRIQVELWRSVQIPRYSEEFG